MEAPWGRAGWVSSDRAPSAEARERQCGLAQPFWIRLCNVSQKRVVRAVAGLVGYVHSRIITQYRSWVAGP